MRRILFSLAAAAILSAASLAPAKAMTPGTAAGILGAVQDTNLVEDVRYVCRHRWQTSRRVCWWTPSRPHYRPYHRPYRPYRGPRRWR